jgi:uncharacterized membrane protein
MNSLRFWQYVFVIGFCAFAACSVTVFGSSWFLALAAVLAIVFGVINSLLSRPTEVENNRVVSAFKRVLNVNWPLKAAAVMLWVATLTIAFYGGLSLYWDYRERQKVTIEGTVLTAGGDLADKATVTLFLKQRNLETWTSGGKFVFSKVDFRDEDLKHVRVHARLGSREGQIEADLSPQPPAILTIKLSPGDPPFRVTYFLLEGQAIDFFLQGKVDPRWEIRLAGQPYIVPNGVYQSLGRLIKSFSESFGQTQPPLVFYKETNGVKTDPEPAAPEQPMLNYFVGSSKGDVVFLHDSIVSSLLDTIPESKQQWKVFIDPARTQSLPYPLVFRRYINRSDFRWFSDEPVSRFYSFITKDSMPPDFGYFQLQLFGICGDDPPWSMDAKYFGRRTRLRVAIVENITDTAIKLGNFSLKEDYTGTIHSRDAAQAQLQNSQLRREMLFPMEMLKPGEKIAIPIELQLAKNQDATDDLVTAASRPEIYNSIRAGGQFYFAAPEVAGPGLGISIPSSLLEEMLAASGQVVNLDKEYLLGPSIEIQTLEADRVEFPFRQFDSSRIVILDEYDSGSCPYVYTYSNTTKAWHNEGVILRGNVGKHRESLAEKELRFFDGRILLKEQDPEDTFIDSIFVRAIYADGRQFVAYPSNTSLRSIDGNRIRLRQGQQRLLSFEVPNTQNVRKFILTAVGYYVPYKTRSFQPQSGN